MLIGINAQDLRRAVTNNTEPFINEGGLGTHDREPEYVGFNSDYVVETEYGQLWTRSFAEWHSGLLAGPCQAAMLRFANDGFLSVPFRLVPRSRVTSRTLCCRRCERSGTPRRQHTETESFSSAVRRGSTYSIASPSSASTCSAARTPWSDRARSTLTAVRAWTERNDVLLRYAIGLLAIAVTIAVAVATH